MLGRRDSSIAQDGWQPNRLMRAILACRETHCFSDEHVRACCHALACQPCAQRLEAGKWQSSGGES